MAVDSEEGAGILNWRSKKGIQKEKAAEEMSEHEVFEKLYGIPWEIVYGEDNPYVREEFR